MNIQLFKCIHHRQIKELLPPIQHSHLNLSRPFWRILALPLESRPYISYAYMKIDKISFSFSGFDIRKKNIQSKKPYKSTFWHRTYRNSEIANYGTVYFSSVWQLTIFTKQDLILSPLTSYSCIKNTTIAMFIIN